MSSTMRVQPTTRGRRRRAWARVRRFFWAPAAATPFAALRIGLAAVLLVQALQIAPLVHALYRHDGFLRGPLMDAFGPRHLPAAGALLGSCGVSEAIFISGLGALYLGALVAMLVGFRARFAVFAVWLLHLVFMMLSPHTNYGADDFANIFLFYLLWAPTGAALALDRRAGRTAARPRATSRLLLRTMQCHLCLAYLLSGIEKASGEQWWNGEAIWRSLTTQGYHWLDFTWLAQAPTLAMIAGWTVLGIEVGYALFIWPRRTRPIWIAAVAGMHAGIGLFLGLHVFAALMIVLTVCVFGVSAEPLSGRRGCPSGSAPTTSRSPRP